MRFLSTLGPFLFLLGSMVLGTANGSNAATLDVPGDFPTIQEAIDAASPGDLVLVAAGVYNETLDLVSQIELRSESGPLETIVDGGGANSVIFCDSISSTVVKGFTLRNGAAGLGGGLHCYKSAILFEGNIVRGNVASDGPSYGGGVYTHNCPSTMIVRGNLITDNWASIGGGVCCNSEDRSQILGNTIWRNSAEYASGIISYNYSDLVIEGNIISENEGGKGLWVHSNAAATIHCNDVWSNSPVDYHGDDQTGVNGNFSLDPLFCHPELEDLRPDVESPCVPGNHPQDADCGWIGWRQESCGPIPGACCYEQTECVEALESFCTMFGGTFLGDGSVCDPEICPAAGACCLDNGECIQTTEAVCVQVGGEITFGEDCAPFVCENPFGLCCLPSGCEWLAGLTCVRAGGSFLGPDADCEECEPSAVDEGGAGLLLTVSPVSPNPSRGMARLELTLPGPDSYRVELFTADGRRAGIVAQGELAAGRHSLDLDLRDAQNSARGRLFLRVQVGSETFQRDLTLIR